jgi:hypothetical protein
MLSVFTYMTKIRGKNEQKVLRSNNNLSSERKQPERVHKRQKRGSASRSAGHVRRSEK